MLDIPKHFESLYPETTREKELSEIVSYIRAGNSSQLIGIAGVGRSSILGLLSYNKAVRLRHFPKNHGIVHFVMTNFSEVREKPLLDVLKLLFLNLTDSLRERELQEEYQFVSGLFTESLSFQDELVLSKGLQKAIEYLAIEKKLTLIMLFDRFDDYVPFLTTEFFMTMRSLRDAAKYRFSVVFSLTHPLEETVEPYLLSDFSDFVTGHHVYVSVCDKDTIAFRSSYLLKQTGKTLKDEEIHSIVALTGGHVRLTKLAVEAVLSELPEEDLKEYLFSKQTIQQALIGIWRGLTPSEQQYLLTNSREEHEVASYLQNIGLLNGGKLTIPLLADFIDAMKNSVTSSETIIYDPETNLIKRGEVVLSDALTRAEFRLLRYLLQNQEQIVDREKIVEVVWKDTATTQGVTEQAIDQLIFRLRRKIEADPNNPVHLQTIKGRGVKFSS